MKFLGLVLALVVSTANATTGILLLGDTGTGDANQMAVAAAMKRYCASSQCDIALLLGDNFYPEGVKSRTDEQWNTKFHRPYDPLGVRFYPVLGNHDYQGNVDAQITSARAHWILPSRYYKVVHGDEYELFALDSNRDIEVQAKWLKEKLSRSTAIWKIVYAHHPIYSYGSHGGKSEMKHRIDPILNDYGVQFYVSGHDHDKQLIHMNNGVRYIVSGAGGKTRPHDHKGEGLKFASNHLGFVHLLIYYNTVVIRYVDEHGATEHTDSFTIPSPGCPGEEAWEPLPDDRI